MSESVRKYAAFTLWIAIYVAVMVWSAWKPTDCLTWWMEVLPTLGGVALMVAFFRRFPLTPVLCWVILIHSVVLYIGGHYTYAVVPFPNLFGDLFGVGRNNFDKIGHFFQGVTPAMLTRELLVRTSPLKPGKWLGFLTVCAALAFSAFYEMIEWQVSVHTGNAGEAFLGTQGYIWDTQTDMFMAMIGATLAMLFLSRFQDATMRKRGWLK
jgi:putative membrane protein